jgi:hypothetical protein
MITFNLKCRNDHLFEGWFRSGDDYEAQKKVGVIECPICSSRAVEKGLQAPSLLLKKEPQPTAKPAKRRPRPKVSTEEAEKALHKLSQYVYQNFEDVGEQFPDEARKIHYGETEKRGIFGQTDAEEEKALHEEGIPIMKIPARPKFDQ